MYPQFCIRDETCAGAPCQGILRSCAADREPDHVCANRPWQEALLFAFTQTVNRCYKAGLVVVVGAVVAVGCGGDGSSRSTTVDTPTVAGTSAGSTSSPDVTPDRSTADSSVVSTSVEPPSISDSAAAASEPDTSLRVPAASPWYVLSLPDAHAEPMETSSCCASDPPRSNDLYNEAWAPDGGPAEALLVVQVIVAPPYTQPEGDFAGQRFTDFSEGTAWLLIPNGTDHEPMDHGFELYWARANGDVWIFQSYGLTTQQLVELVRPARAGTRTPVELSDASMHVIAVADNTGVGEVWRQQYQLAGGVVVVETRNDGGVFGLLVTSDAIRPLSVAGIDGYSATLSNDQVEFVWNAGNGWWASVSIGPAVADRADGVLNHIDAAAA